jgi:hypothetical protein
MGGVVVIAGKTFGFEQVRDALHALTRQPEGARDLRHRHRSMACGRQHLPSGAGLPEWPGKRVTRRREMPRKLQHGDRQLCERLALWRPLLRMLTRIDNMLSTR